MNIDRILILISMFAITSCASNQTNNSSQQIAFLESPTHYENKFSGLASIMSKQALERYREKYVSGEENKAFAQSVSGAWAFRTARTSIEHAKTNALVACQANNKIYEATYPCKIININGEWVGQ